MHRQSSTIVRLLAKKQRTYFGKYLAEGGHRKFLGHFKSYWLKEVVRNSWDILQAISGHKESHGSHGNFYEREQEQCHSVSAEVLHGGLRIIQWHKLCWSCAGVAFVWFCWRWAKPRRQISSRWNTLGSVWSVHTLQIAMWCPSACGQEPCKAREATEEITK